MAEVPRVDDQLHPRVAGDDRPDLRRRAVGRCIVDEEHLERVAGQALKHFHEPLVELVDIPFLVVAGEHEAHVAAVAEAVIMIALA